MKSSQIILLAMIAASGCRTPGREAVRFVEPAPRTAANPQPAAAPAATPASAPAVTPTAHQEPVQSSEELIQPSSVLPAQPVEPETLPAASGAMTLDCLVTTALANNPAVAQAAAHVEALRGRWVQVGLPPNPEAGYLGSELGNDGRGGQNGGYAGQEFVTGGKLRLNRAVVSQEIKRAEQQLYATEVRVSTDVRQAYFQSLIAQRRVEVAGELLRISTEAEQTSLDKYNPPRRGENGEVLRDEQGEILRTKDGEISRVEYLPSRIEQLNAAAQLETAMNGQQAAWRRLSAVVGSELPLASLEGDVTRLPDALDWDEQLARITASSPELGGAMMEISRAQMALERALVQPVPNVLTQASVQYDDASDYTIAGIQAGVPLPLWNRNQGGIRKAQADVAKAQRNADRVELDLKRRLADALNAYSNARRRAATYANDVLPRARETFELVDRGYRLGESGYLDLLNAQRTYSQTNLAYLDALELLWTSWSEIEGLLLSGSLESRPE